MLAVGVGAAALLVPGSSSAAETDGAYTWGSNGFGQLGDGSPTSTVRGTPGPVALTGIADLSAGREHVVALTDQGTVVVWGSDAQGQLGNGLPLTSSPTPVTLSLAGVTDVDDGHYHSLALRNDGTVWGWGYNSLGQLGTGDATTRYASPVRWGSISNAVGVFGGRDMTYVLAGDGTLWCSGGYGSECGRSAQGSKITTPVAVNGLPDLEDVAGGRNHGVALAADGTVWTWGENAYGQLGDGTRTSRGTPQRVAGLTNVVDVGAGAEHSMAVTASGQVYVWGRGYRGELGLGTTSDRLSPTLVPTLSGIVDVDAGRSHSFAIGSDGRLWAWGWNEGRQVSSSSTSAVLSPLQVSGLSNVELASGGQSFSVAVASATTTPPPPPGDPILSDDFSAGLSAWTRSGGVTLDSTAGSPDGSPPSLRASASGGTAMAWRSLPAAEYQACMSAEVTREALSTTTTLLRLRSSTGAGIAALRVTSTGQLRARSEVTGASASAGTLPTGTWRQLEICSRNNQGATDQVWVRVDGTQTGTWSWPTAPVGQVQIGSMTNFTGAFNVDDVVVRR